MKNKYLLKGGTIVTMNPNRDILKGDLLIEGTKIQRIDANIDTTNLKDIILFDVRDQFIIPGFIQAHTHLCQAMFRGYADDLTLMDWLEHKIWPMEAHHNSESIQASAEIALLEMQLSGTTSILDMGTVHHTQEMLETVATSGMRYWGGKCLMDLQEFCGPLFQSTTQALKENEKLIKFWQHKNPLIEYVLCPRFAVSCTDDLLKQCVQLQQQENLKIHIHASESKGEIQIVKERTGLDNVDFLDSLNMLNRNTIIVHGVHLTNNELAKMIKSQTPLAHCPSANLKLASGFAPIHHYSEEGLTIGIGSDGAPCNNTMDPFLEMRLAALIQKPLFGPEALPAQKAFELATLGGAKLLGRESDLGSLEVGKLADIVTVDRSHPSVNTVENPYSALVYSCLGRDVKNVFTNGQLIVKNKKHCFFNENEVKNNCNVERKKLFTRAFD